MRAVALLVGLLMVGCESPQEPQVSPPCPQWTVRPDTTTIRKPPVEAADSLCIFT